MRAVLEGRIADRDDLVARGKELGTDLGAGRERGGRARPPPQPDRGRLAPAAAGRGRPRRALDRPRRDRARPPRTDAGEIVLLVPDADGDTGRRVAAAILRELESGPARVRVRGRPQPPRRGPARAAARPQRGAARRQRRRGRARARPSWHTRRPAPTSCCCPHMSDPAELKRFYSETVRPLVAYDEQYETDLLGTLSTFLDCDANVNATAARLITHRHTVRYRFERVRELTGLDVLVDRRAREAVARAQGDARAGYPGRRAGRPPSRAPKAAGFRVRPRRALARPRWRRACRRPAAARCCAGRAPARTRPRAR